MVRVRLANRKGIREKPAFTSPKWSPARTWRIWAGRGAHPLFMTGRELLGGDFHLRREAMVKVCGVAVAMPRGQSRVPPSISDPAVNTGTIRRRFRPSAASLLAGIGAPSAERVGWGGAVVVLRGRESRSHGEGRQRFRGAEDAVMPKDAPPNGGASLEPVREDMFGRVSGMQTKLHRWAAA